MYGYFNRHVFTIFFLVAAFWPLTYGSKFWKRNVVLVGIWAICCVLLSSFTMLPVVKQESLPLMYVPHLSVLKVRQLGGILMLGFGLWYLGFGTRWIAYLSGRDDLDRSSNSLKPIITGTQVYCNSDIR